MSQTIVVSHGDSAAVVLPPAILELLGVRIGDALEVTPGDGQVILRVVGNAEHSRRIEDITRDVFERRKDAYQRLA